MSKFNHNFKLVKEQPTVRAYAQNDVISQIDFVSRDCMRVAVYKESADILPTFCINPNNDFNKNGRDRLSTEGFKSVSPDISLIDGGERFKISPDVTVTLDYNNFQLKYYLNDKLLFADRAPLAYNFENEFGNCVCHYLSREKGEVIFGLGDKGGALNKAGRAFRIDSSDSMGYDAETTDVLYKHIPFYICENSVGCYGIFYDTSDVSYMDLGNEINNYYEPYKYFKTEDNALVYYVFFGDKLSILQSFSRLCGRQAFPPKRSFDYCASTMAYTDAPDSETQMNKFLQKLKETDLSCGGFYLSSGYTSIGSQRFVFNWNYDKFSNPKRFVEHFSQNGIEIIPNIKPAFLTNHPMYKDIEKQGMFVKNPDGSPFITRFWDGNGSYLDFTNPDGFAFWKNQVKEKLLDNSVKATWNDNNEFDIKDTDALAEGFSDKRVKARRIRPALTYLMLMSSYEAQREKYPNLRLFLSTRAGGVGIRRLAQTWSGDNTTSFHDLKYCHNIGLTMSVSGLSFYGHDLGGFHGEMPSRELLLRWIQHGIFEPRFTIHSWNSDGSATMPWSYDDIIDSVRQLFAQRKQLLPYLYSSAYDAVENDFPLNSPPCFCFKDKNISVESNSFMFGRDILVSFVLDEGVEEVKVHLPNDCDWYLEDEYYRGGSDISLNIPALSKMPYFIKSGSIIPTDVAPYGFKSNEDLVFTVYPLKSGSFEGRFFDDDGVSLNYLKNDCVKLKFTVSCTDNEVTVCYENLGNFKLSPNLRLCKSDTRKFIVKEK